LRDVWRIFSDVTVAVHFRDSAAATSRRSRQAASNMVEQLEEVWRCVDALAITDGLDKKAAAAISKADWKPARVLGVAAWGFVSGHKSLTSTTSGRWKRARYDPDEPSFGDSGQHGRHELCTHLHHLLLVDDGCTGEKTDIGKAGALTEDICRQIRVKGQQGQHFR